ncbi:alpha/beta hydrolase [Pseudonocardiaceae bacterium YIM PH 21723]|nr:alpha/beta hydrolase [Pseudonocardiaceae bacterium YIM PH 21723]
MKRALVVSALSAALLVPATPAIADSLTWTPCEKEAECTTVTVPVDWAKPDGPTLDLTVARHRTTEPSKGVMVYGAGGPGGASAETVKYIEQSTAVGWRRDYDVIGVNARGMDRRYPITCPDGGGPQNDLPNSPETLAKLNTDHATYAAECRRLTGPLYDHLDTASNARDLDAVRAALGLEKISFYGGSYGTLLGQQYAELFPQRVQRMVLDSTMDHSLPDAAAFGATEAKGMEERFDQFVDWCDKTESCALHGQDVRATVTELQKRTEAGELKDSSGAPLTSLTLDSMTTSAAFSRDTGATALKKLTDTGVAEEKNTRLYVSGGLHSVLCQDWNLQLRDYADYQEFRKRVEQAAPMTRFSSYAQHPLSCQGWPVANTNPPKPFPVKDTVPTLVLNSRYDIATVYPWAVNLTAQTGWGLVTYAGSRHVTYSSIPCMREHTDKYLATGELPAAGTVCAEIQQQQQETRPVEASWN